MQQTTQIQATSLEITAVSNEKKSNRLVGFFSGIRDKFSKKAEQDSTNETKPKISKSGNVKIEHIAYANEKGKSEISEKDMLADKAAWVIFIEFLQSLFPTKKFLIKDIENELRKNETLTRELNATMIQNALSKNANLSKELVSAKLEQAINENPNYTQEQKDFYLSKLADKDFMDKFYDTLGIKEIANKAKSNDELLALVNESFSGNFAKAKEKISESKIDSYMEDMEAKKWQDSFVGYRTMDEIMEEMIESDEEVKRAIQRQNASSRPVDEVMKEIVAELKASGDLADIAGKVRKQD